MSFHNNPKYQIPELIQALKDHGLEHDTPSQLADAFRTGWVARTAPPPPVGEQQGVSIDTALANYVDSRIAGKGPKIMARERDAVISAVFAASRPVAGAGPEMVSVGHQYLFSSPFGGDVWRDDSSEWNGNRPKASREIFTTKAGGAS